MTIAVNSELLLYASLYEDGEYEGGISVKWFWADTSHTPLTAKDTIIYLGLGKSIKFKPIKSDRGQFFVDSKLITEETVYTNFEQKHAWQVQTPPLLNIDLIDALIDEVFPGQEDVIVSMHVSNHGRASINNIMAELLFWRGSIDVSDEYEYVMSDNNPLEYASVESDSVFLVVETLATYLEIYGVSIVDPPGATDDTLSTEQRFKVAACIKKQMVNNVFCQLDIPETYTCDHKIQYLADDTTGKWVIKKTTTYVLAYVLFSYMMPLFIKRLTS